MATENNFAYFMDGEDIATQSADAIQLPRVQLFNPHNLRRGTKLHEGGYAVEGSEELIGKVEMIPLSSGDKVEFSTAKTIDVAIIGWSPRYYVTTWPDPIDPGKQNVSIGGTYIAPTIDGQKCRSAITLFVVLKNDDSRALRQLTVRGDATTAAINIQSAVLAYATKTAPLVGVRKLHPFALWVTLGISEPVLAGKTAGKQSEIVKPVMATGRDEDMIKRLVAPDDYAIFLEYRRSLDQLLATGQYGPPEVAGQLLAGGVTQSPPQIAAPASAEVIDQ